MFECDRAGSDEKCAQLQGAVLYGTQLQGATLRFARLQGATLAFAQLQGAELESARLPGASLDLAELQGAWLPDIFVWRAKPPSEEYAKGAFIEEPTLEPKYEGLDCPRGLEACDWTEAAYAALRVRIETVPAGRGRTVALNRIALLRKEPYEEDAVSAKDWRELATASQRSAETYPGELTRLLITIGCGATGVPSVIGGLISQVDFRLAGKPALQAEVARAFLDEANCAGAQGLSEADKGKLRKMRAPESSQPSPGAASR
jgi:hypothetical protein